MPGLIHKGCNYRVKLINQGQANQRRVWFLLQKQQYQKLNNQNKVV